MQLELSISSYQRLSPSVTGSHRVGVGQTVVVGRAPECDWHLPDPNKILSSRHAEIRSEGGTFSIVDTSTNGVFINDSQSPIGKGNAAAISDGDRLRLGDFEICATVHASGDSSPAPATQVEPTPDPAPIPEPIGVTSPSAIPEPAAASQPVEDFPDVLAAGLGERMMADTHVPMPEPSIPGGWSWDQEPAPEASQPAATKTARPAPGRAPTSETPPRQTAEPDALEALWDGLGISPERASGMGTEFYRELGGLTRALLDRLLDMIHARARQKQQLRVAQTLFQRSENNPLKFSATPQDALDSLLLRPHAANLKAQQAVNNAFDDIMSHERALMKGIEAVVADILAETPGASGAEGRGLFSHRKTLETIRRHRAWQLEAYGDGDRMLRSDVFIEAYEREVDQKDGSP